MKGSLAGEVERQGLELQVSDLDHGCSPLRLNGSLLCHVAVKLEGPVPDQPTVAQVAVVHRAGFDADASGALPEVERFTRARPPRGTSSVRFRLPWSAMAISG